MQTLKTILKSCHLESRLLGRFFSSSSGKCGCQLEYFHNLFLTQCHSHIEHLTAIGP